MLEIARRLWPIFIPAFAVLAGSGCAPIYLLDEWYRWLMSGVLWFFAFICLIVSVIALFYDIKDRLQRDYKEKHREPNTRWL